MNIEHWRERYRSLSPPMQWIVLLGVPAIMIWLYYDYVLLTAADWRDEANSVQTELRQAEAEDRETRINQLRSAVLAYGEVELPLTVDEGRQAMNSAITETTRQHAVSVDSVTSRGVGNMPSDALPGVLESGSPARLIVDLRFEARPEDAIDLLADLESHPHIHAVSSVRMSKSQRSGRLSVDLTIESWVRTPEESGRRGGIT